MYHNERQATLRKDSENAIESSHLVGAVDEGLIRGLGVRSLAANIVNLIVSSGLRLSSISAVAWRLSDCDSETYNRQAFRFECRVARRSQSLASSSCFGCFLLRH